jgi:uncharacterized membrane protein YdfJ with MMPL/SSD domain
MLVITVTLDTFIVRIYLVPAICALLGRVNWFPGIRAPITKDVDDMSDELEEDDPRRGAADIDGPVVEWEA